MCISGASESNKFKMNYRMLYIMEIMIVFIVSIEGNDVLCEFKGVKFRVGHSIEPKGYCMRLTCAPDGNYIMHGCPIPVNPKCTVYIIDRTLPFMECCIIKNICGNTTNQPIQNSLIGRAHQNTMTNDNINNHNHGNKHANDARNRKTNELTEYSPRSVAYERYSDRHNHASDDTVNSGQCNCGKNNPKSVENIINIYNNVYNPTVQNNKTDNDMNPELILKHNHEPLNNVNKTNIPGRTRPKCVRHRAGHVINNIRKSMQSINISNATHINNMRKYSRNRNNTLINYPVEFLQFIQSKKLQQSRLRQSAHRRLDATTTNKLGSGKINMENDFLKAYIGT